MSERATLSTSTASGDMQNDAKGRSGERRSVEIERNVSSRTSLALSRVSVSRESHASNGGAKFQQGGKNGVPWMQDSAVSACFECNIEFSLFIRKHHCRACGRIFCEKCSKRRAMVDSRMQRVCDHCFEQHSAHLEHQKRQSEAASRRDAQPPDGSKMSRIRGEGSSSKRTSLRDEISSQESADNRLEKLPKSQKNLEAKTVEQDNEGDLKSKQPGETYRTKENWVASSPAFHSSLRRVTADDSPHASRNLNESNPDMLRNVGEHTPEPLQKTRTDSEDEPADAPIYEHFERQHDDRAERAVLSSGTLPADGVGYSETEACTRTLRNAQIKRAADMHLEALVSYLVASEGLDAEWKGIILDLAVQACGYVRMVTGECRDIRRYVKVKKVLGGFPQDSLVLRGVAFTRNVAHKRMRNVMPSPRLLLLGCAIEYERDNKFSLLGSLAHQEREYLRIAVSKIAAQGPDLLLVEKSVAGVAQEMLLEAGVAVVIHVKRTVMERVAQCTGAYIVPSIELLPVPKSPSDARRPSLLDSAAARAEAGAGAGADSQVVTSGEFCVVMRPGQKKPLVTIDVCDGWEGRTDCAVIIRGESVAALERAKACVLMAVYACHSVGAEVAFLQCCGAVLPPHFRLLCTGRPVPAAATAESLAALCAAPEDDHDPSAAGLPPDTPAAPADDGAERDEVRGTEDKGDGHGGAEPTFRVLHVSPFVAFELPPECSRWLARVAHQARTAEMLHRLTAGAEELDPAPSDSSAGGDEARRSFEMGARSVEGGAAESVSLRRREAAADFLTILEIGGGAADRGKPHQRLSAVGAERALALAAAEGLLWAAPGGSPDSATLDTLRVLAGSALPAAGDAPACVEPSEMWIRFHGEGDVSLDEYLSAYCFNPHAACPAKACGLPLMQHEHTFIHGAARVRVRVSQRAVAKGSPAAAAGSSGAVVHRMRCVTCARMTSSGTVLSPQALRVSFGRFLQALLYERSLVTDDPACAHPLHSQLHSFSRGNRTALFVTEPIALYDLVLPPLRMEAVPAECDSDLAHQELLEVEQGVQRLTELAAQLGPETARAYQQPLEGLLHALREAVAEPHSPSNMLTAAAGLRRALLQVAQRLVDASCGAATDPAGSEGDAQGAGRDGSAMGAGRMETVTELCDEDSSGHGLPRDSGASCSEPRTSLTSLMSRSLGADDFLKAASWTTAPSVSGSADSDETPGTDVGGAALPHKSPRHTLQRANSLARLFGSAAPKRVSVAPRLSPEQVQACLEGSIVTSAVGQCCHVTLTPSIAVKGGGVEARGAATGDDPAVYEDEPTSIIAYALSSPLYARALADRDAAAAIAAASGAADPPAGDEERERMHIKVEMEGEGLAGKVVMSCKVYMAAQFESLRRRYCRGCVSDFAAALSRCKKWAPTGGKSCAAFVKSYDERFILKEISKKELRHFLSSARDYFDYVGRTLGPDPDPDDPCAASAAAAAALPSCLVKVCGVFKTRWRHARTGRAVSHVMAVSEHLWHTGGGRLEAPVTRVFDLKGSARNRFVKEAKEGEVQLDDNFHAYLQRSPLYLSEACKRLLSVCIFNDTVFLTGINVMDYSLLVGVDEDSRRLVVGIIDFLRPYTMDKQAEFLYKSALDVALGGAYEAPTVIPPPEYKQRFRQAMARDFVSTPSKFLLLRQQREPPPPAPAPAPAPLSVPLAETSVRVL